MTTFFIFIRTVSECAMWFGCGGLVLSVFTAVSDLTLALPVLGLCAAVCSLLTKKTRNLRFAGLPVLLALIPFCTGKGNVLLLLPAAVYVANSVVRDKLTPDSNGIYYQFGTVAGISLVGSLLCVFSGNEWCFFSCVVSLVLYVFLCRMLRHPASDWGNRRLLILELGFLTLVLLAALLLSRRALLNAALSVLKQLYLLVGHPILLVLVYLMKGVFTVLNWLLALFLPDHFELPQMQMLQLADGVPELMEQTESGTVNPILLLLVRLVCAGAFLLAGYFLMRFLRRGAGKLNDQAQTDEIRSTAEAEQDVFSPPAMLDRSPEASVRRAYLSYCRWLRDTGVKIARSDTTRSVNRLAKRETDPAATELRQLYLAARYKGESGLSREDARRASQLVREIKKEN